MTTIPDAVKQSANSLVALLSRKQKNLFQNRITHSNAVPIQHEQGITGFLVSGHALNRAISVHLALPKPNGAINFSVDAPDLVTSQRRRLISTKADIGIVLAKVPQTIQPIPFSDQPLADNQDYYLAAVHNQHPNSPVIYPVAYGGQVDKAQQVLLPGSSPNVPTITEGFITNPGTQAFGEGTSSGIILNPAGEVVGQIVAGSDFSQSTDPDWAGRHLYLTNSVEIIAKALHDWVERLGKKS
jgi:hypothetical protein